MAKKNKRQQTRSKKWSRANIMNYIAGLILAVSMVLGSVFVFGGVSTSNSAQSGPTTVATAVPTMASAVGAGATETPGATQTPAATLTPAATPTP